MKEMRKAVLVVVGLVLVFGLGCPGKSVTQGQGQGQGPGAGHHFGQQKQRVFEVYIYTYSPGECSLDWPVATLWKANQQTVTWFSDDNNEYTVDFGQNTPFPSKTFTVPQGASVNSGDLQGATGYFPFAVHAGDKNGSICKKATDPDPGYYVK